MMGGADMTFTEALEVVRRGGRMYRTGWGNGNSGTYGALFEGFLSLYKEADDEWNTWLVSEADIFARDWHVVQAA